MAVLFPATAFFHGTKISNKKPLPNSFFLIGFSVSCTLYPTNPCMLSSPLRRNRRLYLPFPCRAAKPGHTPPPPQSDPPPGSPRISGT
ncbi:hypothetical protein PanWU01x14_240010 [Parasponia andersonii]|uniref:Uncharacterized protein n=1 Tax=Parasponia andersonii TaxID=3476 RepID=A0A2P5BH28_PARAD|nr:hypothetical protein PanWU01x14_240010 [Parasponia andersonii]